MLHPKVKSIGLRPAMALRLSVALPAALTVALLVANGVARAEFRNVLGGLGDFLGLDLLDQVHWSSVLRFAPRARGRLDPSAIVTLPKIRPA